MGDGQGLPPKGSVAGKPEPKAGSSLREQAPLFPQLFPGTRDDVAPTVWLFGRMVQARHVRVWSLDVTRGPESDVNHSIPLQVELLGCEPGTGWAGGGRGRVERRDRQEPSALPSTCVPHHQHLPAQGLGTAVPVARVS